MDSEYNLDGRVFRSISNTANGEVGAETIFRYRQAGEVVTATYDGGGIVSGHLIAKALPNGRWTCDTTTSMQTVS